MKRACKWFFSKEILGNILGWIYIITFYCGGATIFYPSGRMLAATPPVTIQT